MASIQCVCAVLQNQNAGPHPAASSCLKLRAGGRAAEEEKKCRLKIHDPKKSFSRTKTLPLEYPALEKP